MKLNSVRVTRARTRTHANMHHNRAIHAGERALNGLLVRSQQLFAHEAGSLIAAVCLVSCDTNDLKRLLYLPPCVNESADGTLRMFL